MSELWRQGANFPINVYEGDRPVCQCHTAADARRIVGAVNDARFLHWLESAAPETLRTWRETYQRDQADSIRPRIEEVSGIL